MLIVQHDLYDSNKVTDIVTELFTIGLRVNERVVKYLDTYKYGTRSETVRNIILNHIEKQDPIKELETLLNDYSWSRIKAEDFLKSFFDLKKRYVKVFNDYEFACEQIKRMETNGMINGAIAKLNMQKEQEELQNWIH